MSVFEPGSISYELCYMYKLRNIDNGAPFYITYV